MAKIKAIKYLGWKFLRIPHTASEDEALSWPGGFEGAGGDGAVKSVNGKTGSVEITAEDIPVGTDSTVALALESKVSKVGDTMTGQLYIETISRLDTVYSSAIALLPHKGITQICIMHKKRRSDEGKADLWHNRRQNCMINGR